MWKLIDYFAFLEIWSNGTKRRLVDPKTKEVKFEYDVGKKDNPKQLKIPFKEGGGK
jgi:hypothetical protein